MLLRNIDSYIDRTTVFFFYFTLIVIITLAIATLLLSMPNLSRNSMIVPNFKRRMLNFSKNLSAAFRSLAKNPEVQETHKNDSVERKMFCACSACSKFLQL